MKATLEIRTQGVRGGDWTALKQTGATVIRLDYDGTKDSRILIDAFVGQGINYQKRENCLINITDEKGKPVFNGTMNELIAKLKNETQNF